MTRIHPSLRPAAWLLALLVVIGGVALAGPLAASAASTSDVQLAQRDLNGTGYPVGTVDGVAGDKTTAGVTVFQGDQCLTVDGEIGPQTLGALQAIVKQVQTKAGATASGSYDSATKTAVTAYQNAHSLNPDGVAGAATMQSMGITRVVASCHPTPGSQRATILNIARGEIGTLESSGNCVPDKPYNICAAWCAAFSTWVWRDAGIDIPAINYVPSVYDWAVANGKWYSNAHLTSAQPGDMIIFGQANNRYHIGIVTTISGTTAGILSGNTGNNTTGDNGVWEKTYTLSSSAFYGIVHL